MQEVKTVVEEQEKPDERRNDRATKAFESQRDDAIAQVREAVKALLVLVTNNFLADQYTGRTSELDAEDAALEGGWRILTESRSSLAPITESKIRVLQRLADDQMALGDTAGARQKQEDAREVQQNFDLVLGRIQQIESRRATILKDKRRIAHAVFQEGYPSLPISTFAVLESVLDLFDGCKQGMFTFQTLAGLDPKSLGESPLIKNFHIEKLIPGQAAGRQLAYRLAEWFRR